MNKVTLIGNLGAAPEIRVSGSGQSVAQLRVATSENWRDKVSRDKVSGEKRERTEWHRVVVFDEYHVEVADKYLKRGSKVYLEGQLQTRKYVDSQGVERYVTEIVLGRFDARLILLDARRAEGETAPSGASSLQSIEDDELPF